ncbi:hypothetical protein FOA52_003913 [Chlamydomonas sp. UWO 241]|nr:hypothetical protein FOA52_003913 [Chlamydomonas sp. UWO 241]
MQMPTQPQPQAHACAPRPFAPDALIFNHHREGDTEAGVRPAQPQPQPQACKRRPFAPDAAILNFYREGDTLGGHLDDVEPDMDQPIVTISLGCDATFLIGRRTRDVAPLPLLLRSGDVAVLAGEARMCYHALPRIFTDRPLPECLQAHQGDPKWAQYVAHMAQARINISVRVVTDG